MTAHRSLKWSIFAASVISLSWFFAGWRQVNEHGAPGDWGLLLGGSVLTLALLMVQGYWIYTEEKAKGRLSKRVDLFDKIESYLSELKISRDDARASAAGCRLNSTASSNSNDDRE